MIERGRRTMDVVLAFDLGSTHVKWVAVEASSGKRLFHGEESSATHGHGSVSEQDPDHVAHVVERTVSQVGKVETVTFSAAMHSFLAVAESGLPLTQSWTWMDKRAAPTAMAIRGTALGASLRTASGVPVHAMSPLMKWLSIKDALPSGARPTSLKDFLVHRLTGHWRSDYSTAAASGFLGVNGRWLPSALNLAGLCPGDMPLLNTMTARIPGSDFDVVLGGTDGATAHYHLQVPSDGFIGVLAMGTSGAIRTTTAQPVDDPALFSYTMGPDWGHLVGAAFSNVGNVLAWQASLYHTDVDHLIAEGIASLYSGRKLPFCLPYWYGERSPWWREDLTASWVGIEPHHSRADLTAAVLLAIAACYRQGLQLLESSHGPVREIRAGSGLMENPLVAQWMADALEREVVLVDSRDASLLGALDLAIGRDGSSRGAAQRYAIQDTSLGTRAHEAWQRIAQVVTP